AGPRITPSHRKTAPADESAGAVFRAVSPGAATSGSASARQPPALPPPPPTSTFRRRKRAGEAGMPLSPFPTPYSLNPESPNKPPCVPRRDSTCLVRITKYRSHHVSCPAGAGHPLPRDGGRYAEPHFVSRGRQRPRGRQSPPGRDDVPPPRLRRWRLRHPVLARDGTPPSDPSADVRGRLPPLRRAARGR